MLTTCVLSRQGLGTLLLKAGEKVAKQAGFLDAYVQACTKQRGPSHPLRGCMMQPYSAATQLYSRAGCAAGLCIHRPDCDSDDCSHSCLKAASHMLRFLTSIGVWVFARCQHAKCLLTTRLKRQAYVTFLHMPLDCWPSLRATV